MAHEVEYLCLLVTLTLVVEQSSTYLLTNPNNGLDYPDAAADPFLDDNTVAPDNSLTQSISQPRGPVQLGDFKDGKNSLDDIDELHGKDDVPAENAARPSRQHSISDDPNELPHGDPRGGSFLMQYWNKHNKKMYPWVA